MAIASPEEEMPMQEDHAAMQEDHAEEEEEEDAAPEKAITTLGNKVVACTHIRCKIVAQRDLIAGLVKADNSTKKCRMCTNFGNELKML